MTGHSSASGLVFNTRFLGQELTGVQRYGQELLSRFDGRFEAVRPAGNPSAVRGHLWEQFELPRLCRDRLLWSPGNTGPLSVARQVVTMHDASTLEHPEWFSKKFAVWYRFLLPRLARKVRKVITVSEFSRRRLVEFCGVSEEHVVAIPNGIDGRFRPADPAELHAFQKRNQLLRPYFLYLGSLEPRKNLTTLLQAWERLNLPEVELVLGGSAGTVFRDRGFAEPPRGVRLWGRVSETDLPLLLSGATGFIFPSLYEGFGLPPLEAMACGCPVLVSSATCLPEVCGPAFEGPSGPGAALYFDPLNVEQLAEGILRLLALDAPARESFSRAGRAHAEKFTWEQTARLTLQVLEGEMA